MKKIISSIILTATTLLAACVPAAFMAGATAGGVVVTDRRTVGTMLQDKQITCKALVQLHSEPRLKEYSHISATAFNRVLLLVGETKTPELRQRAYELVKIIPNVRRINNAIIIETPLTKSEISKDAWLTTKVKTALLREKGLNSNQIKVITEDRAVYLLGLVTHDQAEIAVNVTRQIEGVAKVVTLFEYFSE